ncbi:hypothetical protein BDZ91DRAFT_786666 [Kalaharituber pfeilii]|nr:hypothetical protein BDZ91DRAFT_786666 [Kalaharituber pfeilii]
MRTISFFTNALDCICESPDVALWTISWLEACNPSAVLDANGQFHGLSSTKWQNVGEECPDPGKFGKGNPFPTYFTVTSYSPTEIRVVYHLYFQTDRFSDVLVANGHKHDWESVNRIPIIVTWRHNSASNGTWTRSHLLKSFHGGYMDDDWAAVQNTFDESNPNEQHGKNKDHPKIYVGWAKHVMFAQRNAAFNYRVSQGCGREFRSHNWWYMHEKADLVPGGNGTPEGGKMKMN